MFWLPISMMISNCIKWSAAVWLKHIIATKEAISIIFFVLQMITVSDCDVHSSNAIHVKCQTNNSQCINSEVLASLTLSDMKSVHIIHCHPMLIMISLLSCLSRNGMGGETERCDPIESFMLNRYSFLYIHNLNHIISLSGTIAVLYMSVIEQLVSVEFQYTNKTKRKFMDTTNERVLSLWLPFLYCFSWRCGWYISAHIITQFAIAINRKKK